MNNSTTTISTVVTPPNYLVLLIDWPFYIFHLSLVLFVAVRVVKRNADFSGGFYVLFLYLAGVDALSFLQLLIFFRLANNGFMIEFIVKSMFSNGIALFGYEASWYISYFDAIGHLLISINRFTAVFFYKQHEHIWNGRYLYTIIAIWLILPILILCWSFDKPATTLRYVTGTAGFLFNDPSIQIKLMIIGTVFTVGTTLIGLFLEIWTAIKYKQLFGSSTIQQQSSYINDIRLYVHSLIMTVSQVPLVAYDVLQAYSIYTNNNVMLGLITRNFRWLQDLLMFGNSILLFILSTTVRQGYLAFYGIKRVNGDRVVSLTTTK